MRRTSEKRKDEEVLSRGSKRSIKQTRTNRNADGGCGLIEFFIRIRHPEEDKHVGEPPTPEEEARGRKGPLGRGVPVGH